jgi:thiol-disulfide isomerase/thioredoxin
MVMKLATVAMAVCSLAILGIVFAQERKHAPALTTDDVVTSGDRPRVRPGDDGRPTGPGVSGYTGSVPREIAWEHDLRAALNNAEDGNRVVVVDVYTDWCGWCKKMDRDIYSDPQVAALGGDAVFLKLNAEDQGEGQRFAREAGVRGLSNNDSPGLSGPATSAARRVFVSARSLRSVGPQCPRTGRQLRVGSHGSMR